MYIMYINYYFKLVSKVLYEYKGDSMGKEGFENEKLLIKALDNKKFNELTENLKNMINTVTNNQINENDFIQVIQIAGTNKTDMSVMINHNKYNISVKMGKNNSVHQEPLEEFISFLESEFNIDDNLKNDIRFFIWGDGTLDGTGEITSRMNISQLKQKYPEKLNNIKLFFHFHKTELITRFLMNGSNSDIPAEFIYHGTAEEGTIVKLTDAINWLSDDKHEKTRANVPVGGLSFQAWNRNIKNNKPERYRGVVQIKWTSLNKDIKKIAEVNNYDK